MKLTWFGNTTLRIHIGGQILVVDAGGAPTNVDRGELVSGADLVTELSAPRAPADALSWRPRPRERLLDSGDVLRPVEIWALGQDCILVEADEDRPLAILGGEAPDFGRWANSAVMVLAGESLAQRGLLLVQKAAPRLIALAGTETEVSAAFAALPPYLDGTGLVALEQGLAVEV